MEVSKEIIELAEKIKKYRTDVKSIEELKISKEALENQVKGLEETIKTLKMKAIKQNQLLDQIKVLEEDKKGLMLDLERLRKAYTFIVATPHKASSTIHGEISREISKARKEILICSPWITYIIDELSSFSKKKDKNVNIRVITRLIKEDVEKGITDLDKFRVLKKTFGADVRYNNDLHAKMIIIDGSVAIISSANLTKKALSVNYEAGICLRDKNMVGRVMHFFKDIWEESTPLTEKSIGTCLKGEKEKIEPEKVQDNIGYIG